MVEGLELILHKRDLGHLLVVVHMEVLVDTEVAAAMEELAVIVEVAAAMEELAVIVVVVVTVATTMLVDMVAVIKMLLAISSAGVWVGHHLRLEMKTMLTAM